MSYPCPVCGAAYHGPARGQLADRGILVHPPMIRCLFIGAGFVVNVPPGWEMWVDTAAQRLFYVRVCDRYPQWECPPGVAEWEPPLPQDPPGQQQRQSQQRQPAARSPWAAPFGVGFLA